MGSYNCIRCLAETDNDSDICDDCIREARDDEMVRNMRDRLTALEAENKALRDMVKDAYNDAFCQGMYEVNSRKGGIPWIDSKYCAALEKEKAS